MKFILTADWHVRADAPIGRRDSYFETLRYKINQITTLANDHDATILIAGDIFHRHNPTPQEISCTIQALSNNNVLVVAGNHDLPFHNYGNLERSGLYTALVGGAFSLIQHNRHAMRRKVYVYGKNWNEPLHKKQHARSLLTHAQHPEFKILLAHEYVWKKTKPFPDAPDDCKAHTIMEKYKQFDLIVTGDNHQSFTQHDGDRYLINPGSIMRSARDQIKFKPRVAIFDTNAPHDFEWAYLNIAHDVWVKQDTANPIAPRIKNPIGELDFNKNLEQEFDKRNTDKETKTKVQEMVP